MQCLFHISRPVSGYQAMEIDFEQGIIVLAEDREQPSVLPSISGTTESTFRSRKKIQATPLTPSLRGCDDCVHDLDPKEQGLVRF